MAKITSRDMKDLIREWAKTGPETWFENRQITISYVEQLEARVRELETMLFDIDADVVIYTKRDK